jgi:hypothetical protein
VETILQALPQSGELGDGVGVLADEPVIPLGGGAAKLTSDRSAPTEQSMRGPKKPD